MKKFSKKLGAIILSLALVLVIAPVSAIFAGCGEKNPPANDPPEGGPAEEVSIEGEYTTYEYCDDESDGWSLIEDAVGMYKMDNYYCTVTITADNWDGLINTESLDNNGRLFSELLTDPTMTWEEYEGFLVLHINCKTDPSNTEYQDIYYIGQIIDTELIVAYARYEADGPANYEEAKTLINGFVESDCEKLYQYFTFCGFGT